MLHEAIFLATCNATMTNKKKNSSCRGGVTRLQLFSQLATRTITNKMAEISRERMMSPDWPILKKVALQVAEGMLHVCNLPRNVAKSRGSFYFSCTSQSKQLQLQNFFLQLATQRSLRCKLQEKLLRVTWPLDSGGGGTPYNGLCGGDSIRKGYLFQTSGI